MSSLLQEISVSQADIETKNGGASPMCGAWAAQLVIEAGLCAAGYESSCSAYQNLTTLLGKYCK